MEKKYDEKSIRANYARLTKYLIQNHMTITTMESATSGQIASLITDTEGASAIMKGAFITYSNEAKILQGVSKEILEIYSVYSKETAMEMAKACKRIYQADIAVGITGTMGNIDPANSKHSTPGQVYFAIDYRGELTAYKVELKAQESRLAYKLAVAQEVFEVLAKMLKL